MNNIDRLKLALGNKEYLKDEEYSTLLLENELEPNEPYESKNKESVRNLLMTQLAILKILSNDIDLFRSIETEFSTTTEAYGNLKDRIQDVENEINKLPISQEEDTPQITQMFYNV